MPARGRLVPPRLCSSARLAIIPLMFSVRVIFLASLLCGLVLFPVAGAGAQTSRPSQQSLLITLGPGKEIYEQFSHNAIWIHDKSEPGKYQDVAFNYGLFSFGGDFVFRFLIADAQYWMAGQDALEMLEIYKGEDRSISIQDLTLTASQTDDLAAFLWNNARPENRFYNYNYYTDNCSTRIRDALDRVVGGAISEQTKTQLTGRTYRFHSLRAMAGNPFLYLCLDYVIGQPGDRDLSRWDEMFLPQFLQEHLRGVNLNGAPIVSSEREYYRSTRPDIPSAPPDLLKWCLLAGCSISMVMLLCDRVSANSRAARIGRNVLLFGWLLLTSLAGLILTFLNLATNHWATRSNENMLQMAPLAITCLVLMPWAMRRGRDGPRHARILRFCAGTSLTLLALSFAGLLLKVFPAFYQANWRIISLSLPVHAAVAMIFLRAASGANTKPITEI